MTDNQTWALLLGLSLLDSLTNLINIVTVDLLYIPAPCLVLLSCVLAGHNLSLCRELDIVSVVEHDEVVQTQITGDTTSTL